MSTALLDFCIAISSYTHLLGRISDIRGKPKFAHSEELVMTTAYPIDFPLAESVEVVQIMRHGQVKSKLPTLAHDLWLLQGYALKSALGDPATQAVKPDNFDAVAELEKLNAALAGDPSPQLVVPWLLILKWALDELVKLVEENY